LSGSRAWCALFFLPTLTIRWEFVKPDRSDPLRSCEAEDNPEKLEDLHPADLAEMRRISRLFFPFPVFLFPPDCSSAAAVLRRSTNGHNEEIVEKLDPEKARTSWRKCAPDAAADLLIPFPHRKTSDELLGRDARARSERSRELLSFDESTGRRHDEFGLCLWGPHPLLCPFLFFSPRPRDLRRSKVVLVEHRRKIYRGRFRGAVLLATGKPMTGVALEPLLGVPRASTRPTYSSFLTSTPASSPFFSIENRPIWKRSPWTSGSRLR